MMMMTCLMGVAPEGEDVDAGFAEVVANGKPQLVRINREMNTPAVLPTTTSLPRCHLRAVLFPGDDLTGIEELLAG
jgi:hypothetical protein